MKGLGQDLAFRVRMGLLILDLTKLFQNETRYDASPLFLPYFPFLFYYIHKKDNRSTFFLGKIRHNVID